MKIPTEPIGSIPRPAKLIEAIVQAGDHADPSLDPLYEEAIQDTIKQFEATGSPIITDGEQRKYHNFWTYRNADPSNLQPRKGFPFACDALTFDAANCVNMGGDYNLDGEPNDRPNAISNHFHASHAQWADGFNLPANFFTAPCLGCVGNLGRNTFVGPGYWALDASIFRNFDLHDRIRLQFRAEAFNLLNHTNFLLGDNTSLHDPSFGTASNTAPPRILQFGLKLSF